MLFIYDLLINFNDKLYSFYEWNKSDKVLEIKYMPIFKIKSKDLYNLVNYKCKVSNDFLLKIHNKTSTYYEKIDYANLFTDSKKVYAFKYDSLGNVISYSSLLLDEEDDTLNNSLKLNNSNISYTILSKNSIISNKLRYIEDMDSYNIKYLNDIYKNKKYDEIEYLYRELFNNFDSSSIDFKYNKLLYSDSSYKLNKIINNINKIKSSNMSI